MKKVLLAILLLGLCASFSPVEPKSKTYSILKHYDVNSMDQVITKYADVKIDKETSADGKGSIKIKTNEPVVINLYRTGDLDVEQATLAYKAKVKTKNFEGKAYLEMWAHFKGKGRFFSRDLMSPVVGDTLGWVEEETKFFLNKGENPDEIELNLVIQGTGDIWVDDIKLIKM